MFEFLLYSILSTITCLIAGYLFYCYLQHLKEVNKVKHIPGKSYPFQLLFFLFHAKHDFHMLNIRPYHNFKQFGPIWRITVGNKTWIYSTKPEHVKELFITKNKHFLKNDQEILRLQTCGPINNVFAASGGEEWTRHRALLTNGFTDGKLKEYFENNFNDIIDRAVNYVKDKISKENNIINISKLMSHITVDIIGKVGFGLNCNSIEDEKEELPYLSNLCFRSAQVLIFLNRFTLNLFSKILNNERIKETKYILEKWPKYMRNLVLQKKNELSNELEEEVDLKKDNLITQMLKMENPQYGKLTIDEVIANSHSLLLAGNDTTSITLSWLWYYVAQDLELQKKLKKECDEFILNYRPNLKDSLNLTFEEYEQHFNLIKNTINEALRMRTPAPNLNRTAIKTITLSDGLIIPKDSIFVVMLGMISFNEKYFGKDTEQFHPERFDNLDLEKERFIFNPFSIGNRKCIGYKFALLEMVDVVVNLIYRYRLELAMEGNVKEVVNFTVGPEKDILVKLIPWNE
ncbi:hypothetical protein ABK040_002825 [Willaertia magna]